MNLIIEIEQEEDGRWIAEVPDLPGVLAYGHTREEAIARVKTLSLRVLSDRIENGETVPVPFQMKVCKELGLESTLNPKGRPRKEGRA
ncbi:MAG: type II toxin-antitoxin system HicB family antitoxin [Nitrospirae bacterium]|nr:type II toxin-antitoxin system HicB family antitoxin [Nitrospirota bacterium]MBA3071218.1 type II toxin-antitoxin system HicB family antitoxin [Nitrospirota bacterium]